MVGTIMFKSNHCGRPGNMGARDWMSSFSSPAPKAPPIFSKEEKRILGEKITWFHHLSMLGSKNADEDNGTDNDNNSRNHGEDKVDIGEKVLQSFHELLIAVYI